ncbi:unnamed protein product [Ranitomeya imitator]|uniref:Asn/Gln amidotransferase domain-containing protein n=1 Tax=Ranitomeya imitator TaxID=111125 RepID=A0ABN9LM68_9NEOB|nr:unnamed protein product [Ranitomeya imitator]
MGDIREKSWRRLDEERISVEERRRSWEDRSSIISFLSTGAQNWTQYSMYRGSIMLSSCVSRPLLMHPMILFALAAAAWHWLLQDIVPVYQIKGISKLVKLCLPKVQCFCDSLTSPPSERQFNALLMSVASLLANQQAVKETQFGNILMKLLRLSVFQELCLGEEKTPAQIIKEKNLGLIIDREHLEDICQKIVDGHKEEVSAIQQGNLKVMNKLIGLVQKTTKGRADPILFLYYSKTCDALAIGFPNSTPSSQKIEEDSL